MNSVYYYPSPVGLLELRSFEDKLTHLLFFDPMHTAEDSGVVSDIIKKYVEQLDQYFYYGARNFDLENISPEGTPFQLSVWKRLMEIPFGKTVSYLELAKILGDEKKVRAVGTANGRNPISIIIPCHRVIGNDGHLVGYGGGLEAKRWLLVHEGALLY